MRSVPRSANIFEFKGTDKISAIMFGKLKQTMMMRKFHAPEGETTNIFAALDSNHYDTTHYSDFFAAMLTTRINLNGDLLFPAFNRFDTDNSIYIAGTSGKCISAVCCASSAHLRSSAPTSEGGPPSEGVTVVNW